MNVPEAIGRWCDYRRQMQHLDLVAASTLDNQAKIALQLTIAFRGVELGELRKSQIELWMGGRLKTCAPVTVRGEMNVLRQILNWCVDEGHLLARPRMPVLSVPSTETTLPSDEAFLWVLANVPVRHAKALEFMMLTGLAPHELERLQARDYFHRPDDTLFVGIGQRADFAVKQPSRRRFVPLSPHARAIWFEASFGKDDIAPVFPKVDAMATAMRRKVFVSLAVQGRPVVPDVPVGADKITPKLMRKWFASKVSNEQPEHVLQRLLGHAPGSPITRKHYVRSTDQQATDAVEGLSLP